MKKKAVKGPGIESIAKQGIDIFIISNALQEENSGKLNFLNSQFSF